MSSRFFRPLKTLTIGLERLVEGRLWLKVLIGLGLGVVFGVLLGPDLQWVSAPTVSIITAWLALPGQVFLAVIQMIVVPLVIASIVRGLASNNNPAAMKQNGGIALIFIMASTALATIIGIGLALSIQPGQYVPSAELSIEPGQYATTVAPSIQPGQLIPPTATDNAAAPIQAGAQGFPALDELPNKVLSLIPKNPLASMVSGEMLQVILFAAILGAALLSIPAAQSKPLFDLLGALQDVSIRIVSWAMQLAPLAVFGLITKLVANLGINVLAGMAVYVFTVILGLLLLSLFYLVIIRFSTKLHISIIFNKIKELLLLAFSTSSSAAVMPMTLQVTESDLNIRPDIARFLIPLGATINMAGTALYQGVATVFLAQIFNVELSLTSYLFVVTMAVAASIGSPATPGAGIVILSMVLEGVGIPAAGIALLLGVDRVLDMCRTSMNVLGDVTTCSVVQYFTTAAPVTAASTPPIDQQPL